MSELEWIAESLGASRAERGERLQSLWSGYGEIYRVHLEGGRAPTAVVKSVRPPHAARPSRSHARKCQSYDVELEWYRHFAPRCTEACRVPQLHAGRAGKNTWTFVLEDLDAAGFSKRRSGARARDLESCLAWLAALHATFLGVVPSGLWKIGTYWHLGTRPEELAATRDPVIVANAPALDAALEAVTFRTLVHGDAKLDNFCFEGSGTRVAAVDFQYVGGGCGVKDVAYLLHGLERGLAARSLDAYFACLRQAISNEGSKANPSNANGALSTRSQWPTSSDLAGWRG